jgi:hypothetical protein
MWFDMLYISLALIILGIVILLYSIMLDAKRRREIPVRPDTVPTPSPKGKEKASAPLKPAAAPVRKTVPTAVGGLSQEERGGLSPLTGGGPVADQDPTCPRRVERPVPSSQPRPQPGQKAVLYEDSSRVIDYATASGSIDPSLEKYRSIRRLGNGLISLEKEGISFHMGKKMYRYDFHRIRDIKTGESHMALFLGGSESVKLFIFENGGTVLGAIGDAFRDYVRRNS